MPEITTFMISERSSREDIGDGNVCLHLINPIPLVRPPYIPGLFSFTVSIGVIGVSISAGHKIFIQMLSPDGDEVIKIEHELPMDAIQTPKDEATEGAFLMGLELSNVDLTVEGKYRFHLEIDGSPMRDVSVYVYKRGM